MRTEAEITAMRDQLERREWGHNPGELNDVVLTTLRWTCDESRSDREVLNLSDTDLSGDTSVIDAIDGLADADLDWTTLSLYIKGLPSAKLEALRKMTGRVSRHCARIRARGGADK